MEKYSRETFEKKEAEIVKLEQEKATLFEQAHEEAIAEDTARDIEREQYGKPGDELRGELSQEEEQLPRRKLEGAIERQIELAAEILGKENVFGPNEVAKTWLVYPENIPSIPFSVEELERAEKMGQMLVLRVDKTADGKPMSLEAMNTMLTKRWEEETKGVLLNATVGWRDRVTDADDFAKIAPRSGWALVSKDLLPDSTNKNYIEQTEVIVKTLKDASFKDIKLPEEYAEAIAEFESQKERLTRRMSESWVEVAKQLPELKINQLTRQSIQEIIYDLAMYHNTHGKRLLPNEYVWSNSLSSKYEWLNSYASDRKLVLLGLFDANGVGGTRMGPAHRVDNVGISLSRRS